MPHSSVETTNCVSAYTTTTLYVGNLEIETRPNGLTQTKRYVGNNVIDTHRSNGTRTTHYLGHDHIGSIDIITDEAGTLLENLNRYTCV